MRPNVGGRALEIDSPKANPQRVGDQSKPNALPSLVAVGLFAAIVIAMLPNRHLYDDETINAFFIRHYDLPHLVAHTQKVDVHPPLQYVANWLIYHLFGSLEAILWVNAVLVAFAIGFLVDSWSKTVAPNQRLPLAVACALNPAFLFWCVSLRWYAYWVPVSVVILCQLYLRPRTPRTLWVVAALSVLNFYVGYLTGLFSIAIAVYELAVRKTKPTPRIAAAVLAGFALILPQLLNMVRVQMPKSHDQASHSIPLLAKESVIGSLLGAGISPHSLWAAAMVAAIALGLVLVLLQRPRAFLREVNPLLVVSLIFLLLAVVAGIAVKDRNLAIVQVCLWAWLAVELTKVRSPWPLLVGAVWLAAAADSAFNVIRSQGTGRGSSNLPIFQVLAKIKSDAAQRGVSPSQVYLVTWNDPFALYGDLAGFHVVSPFMRDPDYHNPTDYPMSLPAGQFVVLLKTGPQAWEGATLQSANDMYRFTHTDLRDVQTAAFGPDPYPESDQPFMVYYESGWSVRGLDLHWRGVW